MKRVTDTSSFLEKAIDIHGNFYSYLKVDYNGTFEKVIIGCPIHGDFEQSPINHLQGNGCKKCNVGDRRAAVLEKFIGVTFNYLTVVGLVKGFYYSNGKPAKRTLFKCRCECGVIKNINPMEVRKGNTKSCGCKTNELFKNSYDRNYDKRFVDPVIKLLWAEYKDGASGRRTRREFNLEFEDFKKLVKSPCNYCGSPPGNLRSTKNGRRKEYVSGIDRIDNDKGYILENCVPCCTTCNFMKRNMKMTDFITHIKRIHDFNFDY